MLKPTAAFAHFKLRSYSVFLHSCSVIWSCNILSFKGNRINTTHCGVYSYKTENAWLQHCLRLWLWWQRGKNKLINLQGQIPSCLVEHSQVNTLVLIRQYWLIKTCFSCIQNTVLYQFSDEGSSNDDDDNNAHATSNRNLCTATQNTQSAHMKSPVQVKKTFATYC